MLTKIGRNFAAQLVSPLLTLVERLVVFGLLIRAWGPNVYADYAVALSAAGMLTLAEAGLNIYFGNVWQKAFAACDETAFRRTVGVAIFLYACIVALLLLVVATFLLSSALEQIIAFHSFSRQEAQLVFAFLASAAIVRLARGSVSQIYRGRGAFARGTVIGQIQIGMTLGVLIIAAFLGARPAILAGLELASEALLGWGLLLVDLRRRYALRFKPIVPTRVEIASIARLVPWFAVQQGAPIVWLQMPVLIMGALGIAATSLVGFINLRTLVNIGRMPVMLLSIATGVEFAMSHYRNERQAAAAQLMATGRVASALMAVVAVAIVLFGPIFVRIWTGRDDLFDMRVAIIMLAGAMVVTPATPIANFLSFVNEPRTVAVAAIMQMLAGFVVIVVMVPHYGALGAATGLALGEAAFAIALPLMTARVLSFHYPSYAIRCFVTAALAAIWSACIGLALVRILPASDLVGFGLACVSYVLLAVAPTLTASAPASLRQQMVAIVRSRMTTAARP